MLGVGHLVPHKLLRHPLAEVIARAQLPGVAPAPEVQVASLGNCAGVVLPADYACCGHAAQPGHGCEALAVGALPCAQLPKPIVACICASFLLTPANLNSDHPGSS